MEEFNLARVNEVVSAVDPGRPCLVWGDRIFSYGDLAERSRRLGNYLHGLGLGSHKPRAGLANYESGQDHLAIYCYNGNEYLEAMLGAWKARLAPFNVNYRYVAGELAYLLDNASARAIVYHATFAPVLESVRARLPLLEHLIQVDDGSGIPLLEGAVDYESVLEASDGRVLPPVDLSPDDLYILYTGGTTGVPKGVLWRQHDIFMSAMGGRRLGTWEEVQSYDEIREKAARHGDFRLLVLPPLMHGAAQWASFLTMAEAGVIVFPDDTRRMDGAQVWHVVERERVNAITVVGDAMARPLLEELERGSYDASSMLALANGGAPLSQGTKERWLARLPNTVIADSAGASETGAQMTHASAKGAAGTGHFPPGPGTVILNASMTGMIDRPRGGATREGEGTAGEELRSGQEPGRASTSDDPAIGWLGQSGWIPLGYLGDAARTARTFPEIGGVRYAVPGDRARWRPDGEIELLGRDAVTINSGGEKIFAEEVEQALIGHPGVADVVVAGRPSERWGEEVVAIVQPVQPVQPVQGKALDEASLMEYAARGLARYKLPKDIVIVDEVLRSPSGKADYRWARDIAASRPGEQPPAYG